MEHFVHQLHNNSFHWTPHDQLFCKIKITHDCCNCKKNWTNVVKILRVFLDLSWASNSSWTWSIQASSITTSKLQTLKPSSASSKPDTPVITKPLKMLIQFENRKHMVQCEGVGWLLQWFALMAEPMIQGREMRQWGVWFEPRTSVP